MANVHVRGRQLKMVALSCDGEMCILPTNLTLESAEATCIHVQHRGVNVGSQRKAHG